jgi:hypothetical protein
VLEQLRISSQYTGATIFIRENDRRIDHPRPPGSARPGARVGRAHLGGFALPLPYAEPGAPSCSTISTAKPGGQGPSRRHAWAVINCCVRPLRVAGAAQGPRPRHRVLRIDSTEPNQHTMRDAGCPGAREPGGDRDRERPPLRSGASWPRSRSATPRREPRPVTQMLRGRDAGRTPEAWSGMEEGRRSVATLEEMTRARSRRCAPWVPELRPDTLLEASLGDLLHSWRGARSAAGRPSRSRWWAGPASRSTCNVTPHRVAQEALATRTHASAPRVRVRPSLDALPRSAFAMTGGFSQPRSRRGTRACSSCGKGPWGSAPT